MARITGVTRVAALGLGSNLGNRLVNLREAVQRLGLVSGIKLARPLTDFRANWTRKGKDESETCCPMMFKSQGNKSCVFETAPWGVTDQPAFLNACILIDCELAPEELLVAVKNIERDMGRVKSIRWGARKIDIDILLMDDLIFEAHTPDLDLCIPHVNLQDRDFVLTPLSEILPNWRHPKLGLDVLEMSQRLKSVSREQDQDKRSKPLCIVKL